MSKLVLPKATTTAREAATPVEGEIFYDKDAKRVVMGDGATVGGVELYPASLGDGFVYGLDYDETLGGVDISNACQRVVLQSDAKTLLPVGFFSRTPAHALKRCVVSNLASRTVAYYLNASDSTKKENGSPAVLTGADGDVMVEIPVTHWRIDRYNDAANHSHLVYLVSDRAFPGSTVHPYFYVSPGGATARVQYVGAFPSVLCGSTGVPKPEPTPGTSPVFATGDVYRSVAGSRPGVNARRDTFRTGAGNNTGGTCANSLFYQWQTLMMAIDAGTLDTGVISRGFLPIATYAILRRTGRTAPFGNGSAAIPPDDATSAGQDYDLLTAGEKGASIWGNHPRIVAFSWRGIENPWSNLALIEDGVQKYQNGVDMSASGYWITCDTALYATLDKTCGKGGVTGEYPTGNALIWRFCAWPTSGGYITSFDPYSFFPWSNDGSTITAMCTWIHNVPTEGSFLIMRGSLGVSGSGSLHLALPLNALGTTHGSRLAC